MAYIINNSRGQIVAVVEDGTVNTTATSLTLVGKKFTPYGQLNLENSVYTLENFAKDTPPGNPIAGQLWYNIVEEKMYAYSGQEWKPVSGLTVSISEPDIDPKLGDLWFNPASQQVEVYSPTNTGEGWIPVSKVTVSNSQPVGQITGELYYNTFSDQLFVFDATEWKLVGPEGVAGFPTTRWVSDTILDTDSVAHAVVRGIANGTTVAIMTSETFTILFSQRPSGFVNLVPGINLSASSLFAGTSTATQRLATPRTINGVAFDGTTNIVIGNNGALIAGPGLLGDDYQGTVPVTWRVDADSANQANKVVTRDSNGNFAASTITANLVGNVTGNATNVTGVVASANGGTGTSSYAAGDILIGSSSGLTKGRITGSGPITVTSTESGINVAYTGGTGNGSVTSVGINAGVGIGVDNSPITSSGNINIINTGVTRLIAGNGVSLSAATGTITISSTAQGGSADIAGVIKMWGGSTEPRDWMFCDGRALSRTTYALLFSRIGTTYGAGDGSTTFNIPNMTNRFAVGGGGLYPPGTNGGSADAVVVSHSHGVNDPNRVMTFKRSAPFPPPTIGQLQAGGPDGPPSSFDQPTGITIDATGVSGTGKNIPPYLSTRFIIKVNDDGSGGGGGGGGGGGEPTRAGDLRWVSYGEAGYPIGWRAADGSAVSRTEFSALFARIGTTYGSGDGSTTFNLPDLRGRFSLAAIGSAAAGTTRVNAQRGNVGGSTDSVVVSHTHGVNDPGHFHAQSGTTLADPGGQAWGTGESNALERNTGSKTTGITINSAGESGAGKNVPPYTTLEAIIKMTDDNLEPGVTLRAGPGITVSTVDYITTVSANVRSVTAGPGIAVNQPTAGNLVISSTGIPEGSGIGYGQLWQVFNTSPQFGDRRTGVIYTNTTGKPIQVCILGVPVSSDSEVTPIAEFLINGVVAYRTANFPLNPFIRDVQVQCIIPPGATYQLRVINAGIALFAPYWSELR